MLALCKKLIIPVLAIGLMVPYFSTGVFADSVRDGEEHHEEDDHVHNAGEDVNIYPFYVDGNPGKGLNIIDNSVGGSHQTTGEELDDIKKEIEEQEDQLQELREQAKEQERNLEEAQQYADSLAGFIENVNNQISQLERTINIKSEELYGIRLAIERINLEIQDKEERIDAAKDQMEQLFREVYRSDSEGIVELLFKYDNFSAFFNQVQARRSLQAAIDDTMNELKILKEELEESRGELGEKQDELESEQDALRGQKLVLEQRRMENRRLLSRTREQESAYQNMLEETRAREQEVNKEIFELEDRLRQALDPDSVPEARRGAMIWPTEGVITQGYGCIETSWARNSYSSCNGGSGGFHNGVDVAASLGTPIRAAMDGTVRTVQSSPYAYGYWVAIDHPNGLVTAYTHMSSVQVVSVGQNVEQGDLVGYMDTTGFSTGPHLHFMVYAPNTFRVQPSTIAGMLPIGATLNPFDYLP